MRKEPRRDSAVVQLLHYRKPMKNPVLVEMLEYWERLRDGRIAPQRSEIDPRQIENALEHAFILERAQPNHVRFRIAGMQLCDLMGMEVRGMPANALIAPESRDAFDQIIHQVFDGPEIVELHLEAARPGLKSLAAQMLLLPMKSDQGEMSRILGCLVADGQTGTPPHRFVLAGKKVTRIIATGFENPRHAATSFAESPDVYEPRPSVGATPTRSAVGPGHLRLVT